MGKSGGRVTIKKYANRRLYDTESSAYITLDRLAEMVREGREFEVVDAKTGEDITRQVLTQIIVDEEARGFTFRPGAALDMRMSAAGPTAADFLNTAPEAELARVFFEYGDERKSRRLAQEIVRRRARAPFAGSDDLVNAIRAVLGPQAGPADFARLFQAVRIAVNEELTGLRAALPALRDALVPGGLLAVISYHSGEDRLVKHAFQDWSRACICPPAHPVCTCRGRPLGRAEPRKPILPGAGEIEANPRARSAKLRLFRVADAA